MTDSVIFLSIFERLRKTIPIEFLKVIQCLKTPHFQDWQHHCSLRTNERKNLSDGIKKGFHLIESY